MLGIPILGFLVIRAMERRARDGGTVEADTDAAATPDDED